MSLFRSAAVISAMTLVSRVTGLIRDILMARLFGVSGDTDAFYVAFRLPNMLRRMFAEGAFQQAFIPMLADAKSTKSEAEAKTFIDRVASVLATVVLGISILGAVAAPALVWVIASGLSEDPATFKTATDLTRIMFPYIFFMSMVALCSAILNTWKHFAVPAAVPVLLNISWICAMLFLAPHMERPIFALAVGVMVGGFLQLGVQLPILYRMKLLPRPASLIESFKDPAVIRTIKLMVPAIFASSVAQISILINTNIASFLQEGSVTWLNYADRLMEFPTALLGVALGTVLLPNLSAAFAKKELDQYNKLLNWGLKLVVAFAVPAAIGLAMLGDGLISVLFQSARFNANDVHQTAVAVLGYSVGLIGLIGLKIVAPSFYAQKDIKTPVKVAFVALVFTQLFNLITVPLFSHAGLALSVGCGACFNAATLLIILRKRQLFKSDGQWKKVFTAVVAGCIVLCGILYFSQSGIDWSAPALAWSRKVLYLGAIVFAAIAAYLSTLFAFGYRLKDLRAV